MDRMTAERAFAASRDASAQMQQAQATRDAAKRQMRQAERNFNYFDGYRVAYDEVGRHLLAQEAVEADIAAKVAKATAGAGLDSAETGASEPAGG